MGAAGLAAALGVRSAGVWLPGARTIDASRLAGLLEHHGSARAVGTEYLRVEPNSLAALTSDLLESLPARGASLRRATDDELRQVIAVGARRDFLEGRTIELDGWVVSLTEARLCAITARCRS
jgi:hypothetical protein